MVKKENKLITEIEAMQLMKLHPTYFGGYSFFMMMFAVGLYIAFSNLLSVKGFMAITGACISFSLAAFMLTMNNVRYKQ